MSGSQDEAVIYVGPASVSMLIGRRGEGESYELLDYLDMPLSLARDIFRRGVVSREIKEGATAILKDYLLTCLEYEVPLQRVRLYNTNILAEARNYEVFLNRLQVMSGLTPKLIDDGDMTRLIYQIALRLLEKQPTLREGRTFVTHIGPGNTRALYFERGRLRGYSNYRLGIFRAREAVAQADEEEGDGQLVHHLEEQIRGVVDHLAQDFSEMPVDCHVAIGAEIQSVAPHVGQLRGETYVLEEDGLERFARRLSMLSADALVRELHLHYSGGEGVVAAMQTNLALARRFGDDKLWVPRTDFQRDLLMDIMSGRPLASTFQEEVMQAAADIGLRYKTDRRHADHVALFARQLFRELQALHGLAPKFELILRVAAVLHEVGMFVSAREHHKHSLYLLQNTEIFGLGSRERMMVALLVRYHRRYDPDPGHAYFSDLTREERMVILKLVSLLRIADALDRSHAQRIRSIQLRLEGGKLKILTLGVADTTVEQLAINAKCDLFREIYGYDILLTKNQAQ
jgi:exopolyphosphatase/guanosine-5'-triphosphate,3'-diphosphate pyrophosphatase